MRNEIWRQALVLCGLFSCSISNGFIFGQMSGMLDALSKHEDGTSMTDREISWIASSLNITSVIGFALAAVISDLLGRRKPFTIFSIPICISWIMLYYAEQMPTFLISRILVGTCFGAVLSMYVMSTAEYTSPKIRMLSLNIMNNVGLGIGSAMGHILGILYHWRTVALIGTIPTALGVALPCFWEESPSWLASKGRFEECSKAFRRLQGHRRSAELELQILVAVEKSKLRKLEDTESSVFVLRKLTVAFKRKYFWKVLALSCVINVYIAAAGKTLFSTLAVSMLEEITGSRDILLFTVFVDGFIILGTLLSCALIKTTSTKALLFSTGAIANVILVILSGCLYFNPTKDGYFPWINTCLLALYFIIVNAGPYAVLEAITGEIFPLELKSYCFFLSGIVLSSVMFLSVKLADDLISAVGYHGMFLTSAAVMSLCLAYIWAQLPETKGRTLQEIELYFKNDTYDAVDKVLNGEEVKVLI